MKIYCGYILNTGGDKLRLILVVFIIVLVLINILFNNNKNQNSILEGKEESNIEETIAVHVKDSSGNYVEQSRIPGSDYVINESKSYCYTKKSSEHDTSIKMYTENGKHIISNLGKDNKCHLWFDPKPITISEILAKYTKNNSRSGEITAAFTGSTPTTVYSKEDDDGTSYVFAGVSPNNWVKLGDIYFRIIRFNGDGSLRLIFSGDVSPKTSGEGTEIGETVFNDNPHDNAYVGLQYTVGQVHGSSTNSTILEGDEYYLISLYGWYNSKIKPNYSSIIDTNAGFCSDRDNYTNNTGTTNGGGTGNTETYYRAYITYYKDSRSQTTYTPVLTCKNASDNLKLPVGLITADEYMLAGGGINDGFNFDNWNTKVWLHTGQSYWTMSPSWFIYDVARVFGVDSRGFISQDFVVSNMFGVRPVINLKSSTLFLDNGADGTSTNPYVVQI